MTRFRVWLSASMLGLAELACGRQPDSVVGRWERINDRTRGRQESIEFDPDGTFIARVGSDTFLIQGTYTQRGETITVTGNYTRTLTLRDSILMMEEGTEYRRVR